MHDTRVGRFDWRTGGAILPLLFLFNYHMTLLGVIFPHLFLALINAILKYSIKFYPIYELEQMTNFIQAIFIYFNNFAIATVQ